jgi:hypothetical protein
VYSRCLFCSARLGRNEVIEGFPVGRRVAFDAQKGRLWVVCSRCARWNLTPLEERWEAIEECERRFRGTPLRVSTDHVGLAQLREGLELVRIGRALEPEIAVWRYGRELRRRRRSAVARRTFDELLDVAANFALTPALVGAVMAGGGWGVALGATGLVSVLQGIRQSHHRWQPVGTLSTPQAERVVVRRGDAERAMLANRAEAGGWYLALPHSRGLLELQGRDAMRASTLALAQLNTDGAPPGELERAVERIAAAGRPEVLFARAAGRPEYTGGLPLANLVADERLALEMASNDEMERRAMEGELAELERAWREAEELAAIADGLALPAAVEARLQRLRRGPK